MSLWLKTLENSFNSFALISKVCSNDVIRSQFYTYHDSWAVVAYVKLWSDLMIILYLRTRFFFSQNLDYEFIKPLWNGPLTKLTMEIELVGYLNREINASASETPSITIPITDRDDIDGLAQGCCNSSALVLELPRLCTKPSILGLRKLVIIFNHWDQNIMADMLQITFSNTFSSKKIWLDIHWNLTIIWHRFCQWLGAEQTANHFLN